MIEWKNAKLAKLEHQKEYLVSDGRTCEVAYLSKWVSLWYRRGGKPVNIRVCYYAEIDLPEVPTP